MTYREFCNLKSNDPMENIFPKGTEPEEAMDILEETFIYHDDHDLYVKNKDSICGYGDIAKFILCKIYKKKITEEMLKYINSIIDQNATAQECVDILRNELIPKDWYISYPCRYSQANTEIVGEILRMYNNPDVKLINRIKAYFKNKKK